MASYLAVTPATGLRVQARRDAHLCNFGAFATSERRLIFDINDLDEFHVARPETSDMPDDGSIQCSSTCGDGPGGLTLCATN